MVDVKSMSTQTKISILYEKDYNLWLQENIAAIKEHRFNDIDYDNLLQELEDMGKAEKNALASNMKILIAHLLKLRIQNDAPYEMKKSWYESVDEHRERVCDALLNTPSLKTYLPEAIEKSYSGARKLAIKEGKRAKYGVRKPSESEYPTDCPFSLEEILNEDFYYKFEEQNN
ncbi:MAG: DUF29 domain-containing protein [Moorea sp. SIO2B7]|nr:DUF29 domain-containing protein [Moorena sp. SIO2B7]